MIGLHPIEPSEFNSSKRAYPFPNDYITPFIKVTDSSVTFTGQVGPIKEVGPNGCQIDDIIEFVFATICVFDKLCPCEHNQHVLHHLYEAMIWLEYRRKDREALGTKGYSR